MANVITRTDLENIKRDGDDFGNIVNGDDTTVVTTREGREVKSAAKAIKDLENTTIPVLDAYIEEAQAWAENPENTPVEEGQFSALHHAIKAAESATAANTAKNDAETAQGESETARDKAEAWAANPEDTPVETDKYSALHWAAKAEEQAGLAAGSATEAGDFADNAELYSQIAATAGNYIGDYPTTPAANKGEVVRYTIGGFKHYFQSLIDNNTNTPALVSSYWFCLTNSGALNGKTLEQIIQPYSNPLEGYASTDPAGALGGGILIGNLTGTSKWIGGVLAPNGKIYGIPNAATQILEFDPATGTTNLIGSLSGTSKWYGGVLAPNGKIYGIPLNATQILEFDPSTGTINLIGSLSGTNKWIGGVLAPNGKIYGIPYDATQILELDPTTGTTNLIGSLSSDTNKWRGGVLAPNGKIYGIPFSATQILSIPYGAQGNQWWALSAYANKF